MAKRVVDPALHTFRSPKYRRVVLDALKFINTTPVHSLPPPERFTGVGVYALYYLGESEYYEHIAAQNRKDIVHPIYVGKAVPSGWRASRMMTDEKGSSLYGRLREHAHSIQRSENLNIEDFRCRFAIFGDIEIDLITVVESQMVRQFQPIWNTYIDGFGNHDPGRGRYDQAPSRWDLLHPGRPWAARLKGVVERADDVIERIKRHKEESGLS